MNKIKCHHVMPDLPALPKHLVEQALSVAHDWQNNLGALITNIISVTPSKFRNSPKFLVSKEMDLWISQNISDQYIDVAVAVAHSIPSTNGDKTEPQESVLHNDTQRKFCLFYLIEKGNADQWTRWCRLKQGPLIPDREKISYAMQKNTADQIVSTNGDEFELLDQVCMPLHTWVYTDVRVLHQAGNHLGERIAIHVSFDTDVFDLFGHIDELDKEPI